MADISNISTPITRTSVSGGRRAAASERAAYADAGDVARRANVLNEKETPQNKASLDRLDRVLGSGQPLRGDVPRGFYLNLKI